VTPAEQWAAFARAVAALAAVAAITGAATIEALRIGAAAAGLLYLLPVLWASARAGLGAGLASAAFAALCYNFFLLEPRFTLRIHGVGDVAAFVVLTAVAVVTSRLASDLRAREIEARQRAEASEAEAELTALLAKPHTREALDAEALAFFSARFGEAHLVRSDALAEKRAGLSPLDAAAAAWALHNGSPSGHASEVMPSADFRFVPLGRGSDDVLALAAAASVEPLASEAAAGLARIWVQARDRLTAEAERQAREEAEQRDEVRRTLLAALGHDFRTPLTVLKSGLAELEGEAPARLGREVDRIVRLSEDLIAAARLESGQGVVLEPVDLVDTIAALGAPEAHREPSIAMVTQIPDDLPLVRADPVMLVHLLGNLVENALRHARSQVVIAARAAGETVQVEVRDDGDGIDPAIAGMMFERFVSGSDRAGGSGLGLAIARDLAQALGGSLSAGEAPGGGACFTLTLRPFTAPAKGAR
jgi:two-component system, OmpR family, sensor histidine kinase KdpD